SNPALPFVPGAPSAMPAALLEAAVERVAILLRQGAIDFVASAVACGLLLMVVVPLTMGLLRALPGGFLVRAAFPVALVVIALFMIYVGPGGIVLYGLARGRLGIALGPVSLFIVAPVIWQVTFTENVNTVAAMTQETLLPPRYPVTTVIVDGDSSGCDE